MDNGRTKKFRAILSLMLAVMLLWGGTSLLAWKMDRFHGIKGTLKIAGGTAHLPVMTEAAKRIHSFNSGVNINIIGGGSSLGIQKVGEGLVDIGNSGRALTETERKKFALVSHPLAIDGIALVVHPDNPVSELNREQIKKIFTGEIDNWMMLGGNDAPIVLYGRNKGSATRKIFEQKMLGKIKKTAKCNLISSNNAMRNIVFMDKNGLGYLSIGFINPAKVKGITIDGIVPSQENARQGKYPIIRTLYMNTQDPPSPLALLFIEYLRSNDGAAIIKEEGYILLP